MSVVTSTTPLKRSSRLKSRRNSSLGKSPSNVLCEQTSNLNFNSNKKKSKKIDQRPAQSSSSPARIQTRKSDELTRTPVHVPHSSRRTGVQEREVWWDLDTPESKRTRERVTKEYEAMEDSPKVHYESRTPKLNLMRNRKPSMPSRVNPEKGDAVLADLLSLVADVNNDHENEDEDEDNEEQNIQSNHEEKEVVSPIADKDQDQDLFDDDDQDIFADEDAFGDDGDDDLLLQATQAVENEMRPVVINPAVNDVTPKKTAGNSIVMEEFNDSFDAFLSQVQTPNLQSSTSTKPTSKTDSLGLKKIVNPQVTKCQTFDGFESGNDSFDDLLSQIEMPEASAINSKEKVKHNNLERNECSPILKKSKPRFEFKKTSPVKPTFQSKPSFLTSTAASQVNKVKFGKFNTFDSPPRERKKVIAKYRSDSHIDKPVCSKEEIERKRKEALARRQVTVSQKRKL